jgi:hypothetical protein
MTPDQHLERRLIALGEEAFHQLGIRQTARPRRADDAAQMPEKQR